MEKMDKPYSPQNSEEPWIVVMFWQNHYNQNGLPSLNLNLFTFYEIAVRIVIYESRNQQILLQFGDLS